MLVVTQAQLELASQRAWEEELLQELRAFAPRLFEIRGREVFLSFVRRGRVRAEAHGFTTRGPVRLFVQSMISLGHRFDEDPQLPRIHAALAEVQSTQSERARALFMAVRETFEHMLGPDCRHAIAALERLRAADVWSAEVPASDELWIERMLTTMTVVFPEKAVEVGSTTLRRVLNTALDLADAHELDRRAGGRVIAALMYALGSGITTDPLYPWVRELLERPDHGTGYDRVHHLANKARIYLDATLETLAQAD